MCAQIFGELDRGHLVFPPANDECRYSDSLQFTEKVETVACPEIRHIHADRNGLHFLRGSFQDLSGYIEAIAVFEVFHGMLSPGQDLQRLSPDPQPRTAADNNDAFQQVGVAQGKIQRDRPAHGVTGKHEPFQAQGPSKLKNEFAVPGDGIVSLPPGLPVTGQVGGDQVVAFDSR